MGHVLDDDGELMFGEIPDDLDVSGDEHEIDVNNDETFGADVQPVANDDLEDFAAQTACLRLDDGWDHPGCSAAPDASQLPIPLDIGVFGSSALDSFIGNESFQSIWNTQTTSSGSCWGNTPANGESVEALRTPSPKRGSSNIQIQPQMSAIGTPRNRAYLPNEIFPDVTSTPKTSFVPPMPRAPTLEELERGFSHGDVTSGNALESLLPTAVSAADLERQFVEDSRIASVQADVMSPSMPIGVIPDQHHVVPVISGPPAAIDNMATNIPMGMPPMPPGVMPPILPPMPPPLIPLIPIWMDHLIGRLQFLPPGCPPVPPFLSHLLKQFKDPRIVMAMLQAANTNVPRPGPAPMQVQSQFGYQRKPPGMPSGRTIEDLAFDQFAGYMSCKERQWLVKIQILQCQGSGNPQVDDYYYVCWRQKRLAEGWKPDASVSTSAVLSTEKSDNKENLNKTITRRYRDRVNGSGIQDHRENKDPQVKKFAGSLGLPSKSTTSNPRHLIAVSTDNGEVIDEDHERRTAGSQKKLRTLLLRIESATSIVLECSDILAQSTNGQQQKEVLKEVHSRFEVIFKEMCGEDLPRVLQVGKVRSMLVRLLKNVTPVDQALVIASLFVAVCNLPKKVHKELTVDFVPSLFAVLASLNREQLISFVSGLQIDSIRKGLLDKNTVCRDLFLNILLLCAIKKATSASSFFQWLRGPVAEIDLLKEWASPVSTWWKILRVPQGDVNMLAGWLTFLAPPLQNTLASHIANTLVTSQPV